MPEEDTCGRRGVVPAPSSHRPRETKSEGARHAFSFYDDVRATGLLNETMLALRTEGLGKTVANRMPFAIRMVAAGKMNPLHAPKPVPGIESVRRLYEFSQKMEKEV